MLPNFTPPDSVGMHNKHTSGNKPGVCRYQGIRSSEHERFHVGHELTHDPCVPQPTAMSHHHLFVVPRSEW